MTLSDDCTWNNHVDVTIGKAGKALILLQQNVRYPNKMLIKIVSSTYARAILEYACAVCDPAQNVLIGRLENIQNRAVRFVLGRCDRKQKCSTLKELLK